MFVLSKLVGVFLDPGNLILLLLVPGAVLSFTRLYRLGRVLAAAGTLLALVIATVPLGHWLTAALENRFPAPPLPERADGIIVLGGVIDQFISAERGQTALNGAAERVTAGLALARRFPEAKVVFSGGSGAIFNPEVKEADAAAAFFDSLGLDRTRLALERQSRNTLENARFTHDLVKPEPGEVWLLVTSAAHMPRSVAAFRATGWEVVPHPVDYQTAGRAGPLVQPSLSAGIGALGNALHEWVGLLSYRLLGHSDRLLPEPRPARD